MYPNPQWEAEMKLSHSIGVHINWNHLELARSRDIAKTFAD